MIPTESTVSLRHTLEHPYEMIEPGLDLPYSHEFNVDVNGEGFLERGGLCPAGWVVTRVHFVGKGNLLVVARGKQPNLY